MVWKSRMFEAEWRASALSWMVTADQWSSNMAFEALKTEISILLTQIAEKPESREELEIVLREKLAEMKAFGMPLPADLVELEAALDEEMTSDENERAGRDGD
jgi:hypothetical protein